MEEFRSSWDEIRLYPHTSLATLAGILYLFLVSVSWCYVSTEVTHRRLCLLKLITVYDLGMVGYYLFLIYRLYHSVTVEEVSSTYDHVLGDDAVFWVKVHAYTRALHYVDTLYAIVRGNSERGVRLLVLHTFLIVLLWAFVLDNPTALRDASTIVVAICMSMLYAFVYFYWAHATWEVCVVPASQVATAVGVALYCLLLIYNGGNLYYTISAKDAARITSTAAWFLFSLVMCVLTLKLFWRHRRGGVCCTPHAAAHSSAKHHHPSAAQPVDKDTSPPLVQQNSV